MFPQVVRLDTAVRTVGTGVGSFSGVSHHVGLQIPGLPEGFPTVSAVQFGLRMDLHVFLEVVLSRSLVVALLDKAVEVLVFCVFEQHMLVMMTFH